MPEQPSESVIRDALLLMRASVAMPNDLADAALSALGEVSRRAAQIRDRNERYRSDTGDPSRDDYYDAKAIYRVVGEDAS